MFKKHRIVNILAAFLAVSFDLSGCSSDTELNQGELSGSLEPQPLENPVTLKVSIATNNEGFAALKVADVAGEFAKENITIEYVALPSTEAIPALASGLVDVSAFGITVPFFNAIAGGAEVKMVYAGAENAEASGLFVKSEIADQGAAALKGKIIGLSQGWGQMATVIIEEHLATGGLTLDDLEVAIIPIEDIALSLDSGVIDMAHFGPPNSLLFLENGKAKKVVGYPKGARNLGYAFGPRLLEEEPEIGQAFIRALMRTTENYLNGDYKADPEKLAIFAEAIDVTEEDALLTESVDFTTFSQSEIDNGAFDFYRKVQELWIRLGDLLTYEEPLTPSEYADWSFVQRILDNK
ncbi:MAG: ABC transporter substrate-binding protein [Candidatus Nanopelagicales bacterium]